VFLCDVRSLGSMSTADLVRRCLFRRCFCRQPKCVICSKYCYITLTDGSDVLCPVVADDGLLYDARALRDWVCSREDAVSVVDQSKTLSTIVGAPMRPMHFASHTIGGWLGVRANEAEESTSQRPPVRKRADAQVQTDETTAVVVASSLRTPSVRMPSHLPKRVREHAPLAAHWARHRR
jgi:hypothetical protein